MDIQKEKTIILDDLKEISPDFLIVTANENEKNAIIEFIQDFKGHIYSFDSINGNKYLIGQLGKYLIAHLHLNLTGSFRPNTSHTMIEKALNDFCKSHKCVLKAVFVVGIAFGIDETTQRIGDILVSNKILPYSCVKVTSSKSGKIVLENRNVKFDVNVNLYNAIKSFNWRNNSGNKVFYGGILSGEETINNSNRVKQLKILLKNENVIGGEMEGAGIALALDETRIDYIVIKAICDWGYNKDNRKDEYQKHAARNSAMFLYDFFCGDALRKVYRAKIYNYEKIEHLMINGIKLFWHRQNMRMTYEKLLIKLNKKNFRNIDVSVLKNLESVVNENKFNTCKYKLLVEIEKILDCQGVLTDMSNTEIEKNFYKNFDKNVLCPTSNIKAVIFDFDGTLTDKKSKLSSWQRIWKLLNYDDSECRDLFLKHARNEITHEEWCFETEKKFKEKELTKAQVLNLSQEFVLIKGCKELLQILNDNKVKVYICSGSINTIVDNVLEVNGIKSLIQEVSYNKFYYNNDGFLDKIIGTEYDFIGKKIFIDKIISQNNYSATEVAFVGNSDNDRLAYQSGARTILINANNVDPTIDKEWNYYLGDIDDLRKLLPYLLPEKYFMC